ncbi:hypothetical protein [Bradyrhizobium altum]|uniref:hypothetical protein n=1 Tax=Bradyrhizobium altum TaxID=1571202 RepID=UPI001E40B0D6|nr:hypothetical protein [Bradyrhizobium altum]
MLGGLAGIGASTVDAADGGDSGEAVLLCQLGAGATAAIALDGQHIVALPVADGLRRVGPAMQSIGGDKSAFQIEQGEDFENAINLVAIGALPAPCEWPPPRH